MYLDAPVLYIRNLIMYKLLCIATYVYIVYVHVMHNFVYAYITLTCLHPSYHVSICTIQLNNLDTLLVCRLLYYRSNVLRAGKGTM